MVPLIVVDKGVGDGAGASLDGGRMFDVGEDIGERGEVSELREGYEKGVCLVITK